MSKIIFFLNQCWHNKTIYRLLFNWQVFENCSNVSGQVLDLAGGQGAGYLKLLPTGISLIKTDYRAGLGIDKIVDLNQPFPFESDSIQTILFFNALYIVDDLDRTLLEIKRVLSPGGICYIASPFLTNEMPEPHDYCRLTAEGLENKFKKNDFVGIKIKQFGNRFSSAVYLLSPIWWGRLTKILIYSLAILSDLYLFSILNKNYPAPLGYFCHIKKQSTIIA